jgi:hypothetical protein
MNDEEKNVMTMNSEEKNYNLENKNNILSSNSTPPSNWQNDITKQKLIFSILVNGIILTGAIINVLYLRHIYTDQIDLDAQLYLSFIFLAIVVYCYFKASFTSPVQTEVDKYFNFSMGKNTKGNSIINIDSKKYPSKCEFCNKIKYERTSHCRVCKICVLRRDHHCVWIGNCVGMNNNQYFFNFCSWVVVSYLFL